MTTKPSKLEYAGSVVIGLLIYVAIAGFIAVAASNPILAFMVFITLSAIQKS